MVYYDDRWVDDLNVLYKTGKDSLRSVTLKCVQSLNEIIIRVLILSLIVSENSGHIEERRVKPNYAQHCVLQCTDERLSGRTCNFYIVLTQKVGEPAICKYGYLPGIDYFIFLKKEKSSTSTAKVRVLVGQNFGKIKTS